MPASGSTNTVFLARAQSSDALNTDPHTGRAQPSTRPARSLEIDCLRVLSASTLFYWHEDDDIRLESRAVFFIRQHHLIDSVSGNTKVEHLPVRPQVLTQECRRSVFVLQVNTKGEGVTKHDNMMATPNGSDRQMLPLTRISKNLAGRIAPN